MSTQESAISTTTDRERITTMQQARTTDRPTLTVTEVAHLLGLDYRTINRAVDDGTITGVRLGRRILIPRRPFLAMLGEPDESAAA